MLSIVTQDNSKVDVLRLLLNVTAFVLSLIDLVPPPIATSLSLVIVPRVPPKILALSKFLLTLVIVTGKHLL